MSSCSAEDESVYRTRHGILGTRWLSFGISFSDSFCFIPDQMFFRGY